MVRFYDKELERIANNPKLKNLPLTGNRLRIEIATTDFKGTMGKLEGIQSVSDLMLKYRKIALSFIREIKRVQMLPSAGFEAASFKEKRIADLKNYALYKGIISIGAENYIRFINELDYNKQEKYNRREEAAKILNSFEDFKNYSRKELIKDVAIQMIKGVYLDPMVEYELL